MGPWAFCFWVMTHLRREAPSKYSSCSQIARLPPLDPPLSCLIIMLLSVPCDVTVLLCKSNHCSVLSSRHIHIHGDGWYTHHVWSCIWQWIWGMSPLPGRISRLLNSRQKNIFYHLLAPWERGTFALLAAEQGWQKTIWTPELGRQNPGWHCWTFWDKHVEDRSCRTHCPLDFMTSPLWAIPVSLPPVVSARLTPTRLLWKSGVSSVAPAAVCR
jgi:hypothetical protein